MVRKQIEKLQLMEIFIKRSLYKLKALFNRERNLEKKFFKNKIFQIILKLVDE
jgi:hypothetical protein